MSPKKLGMFVLALLLIAISAHAERWEKWENNTRTTKPAKSPSGSKSSKPSAPLNSLDLFHLPLPPQIAACQPPCPSGYNYEGPTTRPGGNEMYQGYWYSCKVDDDIKNRASCAPGFTKSWSSPIYPEIGEAFAYHCINDCVIICGNDLAASGYTHEASQVEYECINDCPYNTPVCPDGFTFTDKAIRPPRGYTCIFPGYVADYPSYDESTKSYSPPNSWRQGYCSSACGSYAMSGDPSDGSITCLKQVVGKGKIQEILPPKSILPPPNIH